MNWITSLFHTMNRRTDLFTLWPLCKRHAKSLNHAKALFYAHAANDPAWTEHYTETELVNYVDKLS